MGSRHTRFRAFVALVRVVPVGLETVCVAQAWVRGALPDRERCSCLTADNIILRWC